jgi:uncharacterized protein YjbI with pentapeptide repeats
MDLSGVDLSEFDLSGLDFSRLRLVGAKLVKAILHSANFVRAKMTEEMGLKRAFSTNSLYSLDAG